jgi:hypothetical protein
MKIESHDLFPVHVKVIDFDDDPTLNDALLHAARTEPELLTSTTGKSVLQRNDVWVERLRGRFDAGLRAYLKDTFPSRTEPFDLEAYVFFNYTNSSSYTPVHDHLVEADLIAIYYAVAPEIELSHESSYYTLGGGALVLHDPRPDARTDRRGVATRDHFRIQPRPNRLVIHPASIRHSVAPSNGFERLAVTCTVTVNRPELFEGYVRYRLG